jgi:K+ transporter
MAAGFQFSESRVHMACHITVPRDHKSEGGTLSLTALARRVLGRRTTLVLLLGTIGASMFSARDRMRTTRQSL